MNNIIGHEKILDFFTGVQERNVFSHAYAFVGPEHVGKRTVAEHIAAQFLGTTREKLLSHPDMLLLERGIDEKKGTLKKDISVDQMRDMESRLWQKPFLRQPYKIAIIDHAQYLNIAGSNSFLKILEEPPAHTIIFLITPNEDALLPTIRSRAQMIYFSTVDHDTLARGLTTQVDADILQECITAAHGRPGLALTWVNDRDAFKAYQDEMQRFLLLMGKPLYEKLHIVEPLFGDKKADHIRTREQLSHVLDMWQIALYRLLKERRIAVDTGIAVYERMRNARYYINKNIHPRLLFEHILLLLP